MDKQRIFTDGETSWSVDGKCCMWDKCGDRTHKYWDSLKNYDWVVTPDMKLNLIRENDELAWAHLADGDDPSRINLWWSRPASMEQAVQEAARHIFKTTPKEFIEKFRSKPIAEPGDMHLVTEDQKFNDFFASLVSVNPNTTAIEAWEIYREMQRIETVTIGSRDMVDKLVQAGTGVGKSR